MYVQDMKARGAWLGAVAVDWVKARSSLLGVSIRNNTDQNYESAVVELTLLGLTRANVFAAEGDAARVLPLPEEPEEWGSPSYLSGIVASRYATTPIAALAKPTLDIEEPSTGQVFVRYPELRIRPRTTHTPGAAPARAGAAHGGRVSARALARDDEQYGRPSGGRHRLPGANAGRQRRAGASRSAGADMKRRSRLLKRTVIESLTLSIEVFTGS